MVIEERNPEVIDKNKAPVTTEKKVWHPWLLAIVYAEGDLALVCETHHDINPEDLTAFALEKSEEITMAMYDVFKAKLVKNMGDRLEGLSDGNALKLFEIVKGNPGFSQVVVEGAGGEGERPKFTISMGVQKKSNGSDD